MKITDLVSLEVYPFILPYYSVMIQDLFPFQNSLKDLGPSNKTDLDL